MRPPKITKQKKIITKVTECKQLLLKYVLVKKRDNHKRFGNKTDDFKSITSTDTAVEKQRKINEIPFEKFKNKPRS